MAERAPWGGNVDFPFAENADATFNSSLIFELGVMKDYAEPLLRGVPTRTEAICGG